jgi:MFS family permease
MRPTESRRTAALAALGYGAYRQFAASLLLTSLGVQLIQTAILWQVYELTGDALLLGLTGLARAAPHIVLSLVGGVAADRVNRVRLVQSGQLVNGVLVLGLAGVTLAGSVEVWQLYVVTIFNGAFTALTQPARTALIPWLIPRDRLVNGIALNATITQTSQIAGPALGGLAIGLVGLGPVYLANGVFYIAAMIVLAGIRIPPSTPEAHESPWQSLLDGLAFVRRKPAITSLLALDLGETVLGSYRALLPILSTNLGAGPGGYGLLSAAPGIGSLAGTAYVISLGDMKYKGLYTVFGVLGYCVALVLLALAPWFWLALVAAGLLGAMNSVQAIPRNSAIIAMSPDALRGRVESFRSMLAGGGPPLGYTLNGALAAALGPTAALVGGAIACIALVAGIGLSRSELRDPYLGSGPE